MPDDFNTPEVPDVPEQEATEDPWAWATDLDPATVQETYENVTAMRRSADEKYRAAAEERRQAEQLAERAQQFPQQAPTPSQPRYEPDPDPFMDDGVKQLQGKFQGVEERQKQYEEQVAQELFSLRHENLVNSVARSLPDEVASVHGSSALAAEQYVNRALSERIPVTDRSRISVKVEEYAKQDRERLEALVNQRLEAVSKAKARAQAESSPPATGPQRTQQTRPKGSEPVKARMGRKLSQDVQNAELAEFEKIIRETAE